LYCIVLYLEVVGESLQWLLRKWREAAAFAQMRETAMCHAAMLHSMSLTRSVAAMYREASLQEYGRHLPLGPVAQLHAHTCMEII